MELKGLKVLELEGLHEGAVGVQGCSYYQGYGAEQRKKRYPN